VAVNLTFLGTADAFNTRGQCHACHLITTPSHNVLLDCGPSILIALKRAGLEARDVDTVLLSHLHGDHFAGVPFLILAGIYDAPRTKPLTVVGPPGTEKRIFELYRTMYREISQRSLPYEFRCIEVDGTSVQKLDGIELNAFPVPHQEFEISLGLRVSTEGKSILYSGDTGWTEDLVAQSQDTDLFVCECCFFETRVDFHLDYPRIAENRDRFGCRRLVLTHIGREVAERLAEIDCEVSDDGLTIEV
jgi:ribonuclease BN (tRNA processing enzyme)